jgi:hypothetical protein
MTIIATRATQLGVWCTFFRGDAENTSQADSSKEIHDDQQHCATLQNCWLGAHSSSEEAVVYRYCSSSDFGASAERIQWNLTRE